MHWFLLTFFCFCFSTTPLFCKNDWQSFKNDMIARMDTIPGWCSTEKAFLILELVKEHRCLVCVEIGVLSGKSLLPIAKALQYNKSGKVFGIDAWDPQEYDTPSLEISR